MAQMLFVVSTLYCVLTDVSLIENLMIILFSNYQTL